MKIEINIVKNGDENPRMIVTTPSSDEVIVKDIPEEAYQEINETALEDIMTGVSGLFRQNNENARTGFQVQVFKDKMGNEDVCQMLICNLDADKDGMIEGCGIVISKKQYKKFRKATLLDRFEMTCNSFIELIEDEKSDNT